MKSKVLLVDDKTEFRTLVKLYLATKYEVETAENGLAALSLIKSGYKPDIIVSDLMMPEVDGETFVTQVRASAALKNVPIIILSSIDKSSKRVDLIKNGANDYLTKPFNPEELEIRIENLLKISSK